MVQSDAIPSYCFSSLFQFSTEQMSTQHRIDNIIDALQEALTKCQSVDYRDDAKCNDSAPFAIGWTSSTIKNALFDLNILKQELN